MKAEVIILAEAEPVFLPGQAASDLAELERLRRGTEAVFDRTLAAMFDAMENLARAESALLALARTFAPAELARLRAMQDTFQDLAADVEAKVARSREAARRIERLMQDGRGRLDDLRRLTRSASLVALNAQVVSGTIRADSGALDRLARTMREVLSQVSALVAELGSGIDRGEEDLRRVGTGAADLQGFADREAMPAIHRFAALVEARACDKGLARAAGLVSGRLAALQGHIGIVVTHLQVGDSFRQRLEHVETILAMAAQLDGEAAATVRRIAGAQIRGALSDLNHAVHEGRRGLRSLGRTAGAIPRALEAGGFQDEDAGGLAPLVAGAGRIERAIEGLTRTGRVLSEASDGLARALAGVGDATRTAAEFEKRMTVLGLNAILLASRMGSEGRAMVEVAQQLRDIARSITERISLLRQDTEGIAATAGGLDAPEDGAPAGRLAAAIEATGQVSDLARSVEHQLGEMAAARPAADIAEAFQGAERELANFAGPVQWLVAAADRLDPGGSRGRFPSNATEDTLAEVRRVYTMQAEREIHDAMFPHLAAPATAEGVERDELFA